MVFAIRTAIILPWTVLACQMQVPQSPVTMEWALKSGEIAFEGDMNMSPSFIPSDANAILEIFEKEGRALDGYSVHIESLSEGLRVGGGNEQTSPASSPLYLIADSPGEKDIHFQVLGRDGGPLISARASFLQANTETPPPVSLSETNSRDENVSILVAGYGERRWRSLWLDGDVHLAFKNKWLPTNSAGRVDVKVPLEEGVKLITVRAKDDGGFVSKPVSLSLNVDLTSPQNCSVEFPAPFVQRPAVNIRVAADEGQTLYARVLGDINETPIFQDVSNGKDFWVMLSPGYGPKKLKIFIKDQAENFCPPIDASIVVDPTYSPLGASLKGFKHFTLQPNVVLNPRIDSFRKTDFQVYVDGNVENGPNTFRWIPYADDIPIALTDGPAQKTIFVKFRDAKSETDKVWTTAFFRPYAKYYPTAGGTLVVAQVYGATSVTVEGCGPGKNKIPMTTSIACTAAAPGSDIFVTYLFGGGEADFRLKAENNL